MKSANKKWALALPIGLLATGAALFNLTAQDAPTDAAKKKTKVLYVTHEPGKYHAYTPQKEAFIKIAEANNWDLSIITGGHDEVEEKLATSPDFAKEADVVVYNICMARSAKLNAPHNIMRQTKEHGVPALLIHCAMHSFMPTYTLGDKGVHPEGAHKSVATQANLLADWKKAHPTEAFPAWPNFTGIASRRHGPKKPIEIKKITPDHPALAGVPEYVTPNTELYNNVITAEQAPQTKPLLNGVQKINDKKTDEAIVLWENPYEGSKVLAFTLGHDMKEWSQPEFQKILANSVNYLNTVKAEKK